MFYVTENGPVKQLLDAAKRGNINDLKRNALKLSVGGGLAETFTEVRGAKGCSVLHFAAEEGKTNICRYLILELKVNIDLRDHSGMHWICSHDVPDEWTETLLMCTAS